MLTMIMTMKVTRRRLKERDNFNDIASVTL